MASKPVQREAKKVVKEVAKEIVKEAKNPQQRRHWPRRRWNKPHTGQVSVDSKKQMKQTADKEVTKKLKKEGLEGPKPRFSVHVSATIGKIGPNKNQGPELQIATFLHPALMKEPNDGTNFGPLQAAAAQWGLWRLSSLKVSFTPLVGSSAVTGSVYRASLNLTQSPGNANWGGLGARKHLDVPVGRSMSWKLSRGDLAGPRQTWWLTDTNEEGGQSCGPMLEVHGLGKTTSTYRDEAWVGDLFIVEVVGRWEFTNYNSKPALGTLDRKTEVLEGSKAPSMAVGEDGILTMTLQPDSQLSVFMGDLHERNAPGENTIGETIWQVVDEGAGIASTIAPQPFGWLIRGAWWFVKKIAGRAANGATTYQVYASLADAQNGKPVMAEQMASQTAPTTLTVTQVNTPNTGPGVSQPTYQTSYTPYPLVPKKEAPPQGTTVMVFGQASPVGFVKYPNASLNESVVKAHLRQNAGEYWFSLKRGANKCFASAAYLLRDYSAIALAGNRVVGCYDPDWFRYTGVSVHYRNLEEPFGQVIAYELDNWGAGGSNNYTMGVWLVRTIRALPEHVVVDMWPYIPSPYVAGGSCLNPPLQVTLNKGSMPHMTKPESQSHLNCSVRQAPIPSGSLMVVYSLGTNTPGMGGLTAGQPFPGSANDSVLNIGKSSSSGFWAHALTPIFPNDDFMAIKFQLPNSPTTEDASLMRLFEAIEQHFNLTPVGVGPQCESDSDGESDVEPPAYHPVERLAKERVYEALRESEWDHVDAETLVAAMRNFRMPPLSRGHAE